MHLSFPGSLKILDKIWPYCHLIYMTTIPMLCHEWHQSKNRIPKEVYSIIPLEYCLIFFGILLKPALEFFLVSMQEYCYPNLHHLAMNQNYVL